MYPRGRPDCDETLDLQLAEQNIRVEAHRGVLGDLGVRYGAGRR